MRPAGDVYKRQVYEDMSYLEGKRTVLTYTLPLNEIRCV